MEIIEKGENCIRICTIRNIVYGHQVRAISTNAPNDLILFYLHFYFQHKINLYTC